MNWGWLMLSNGHMVLWSSGWSVNWDDHTTGTPWWLAIRWNYRYSDIVTYPQPWAGLYS